MGFYYSRDEYKRVATTKGGTTIDHSLLYRFIVSPLCGKLVKLFPTWLAPNLMTLIGYMCNITSFILLLVYTPNMTEEAPRWVYFAWSFLITAYNLLDNMDGKQAFRTGSSSSLGELFDHGCDSQSIAIGILVTAASFQAGPYTALVLAAPGFIAFYLAHWQEYFNHFLELGYFNGPTEAEVIAALIYLITGIAGPQLWQTHLFTVGSLSVNIWMFFVYVLTVPLTIYTAAASIYAGLKQANGHGIKPWTALSQLLPFSISFVFGAVWVLVEPQLYKSHPNQYLIMLNLLFSYLVINCIVQRMCDLTYSYFYKPMLPLILSAITAIFMRIFNAPMIVGEILLYICLGFYLILFFHFATEIILNFSKELKIRPFIIPYPNKATKNFRGNATDEGEAIIQTAETTEINE